MPVIGKKSCKTTNSALYKMEDIKKLKYDTDFIIGAFSLERNINSCGLLNTLMEKNLILLPEQEGFIEKKRQLLAIEGEFWNEEELKMHFLAHLFEVIQMNEPQKIKIFYERPLADIVNGYKLSAVCDMLLATPFGINTPKKPYFFLQEYKKAKGAPDAEGQMLVAMLLAQQQNANNKPMYGCWLQGKNWVFTTLHQKKYCVSQQYDATNKADLMVIMTMLFNLKKTILTSLIDEL